MKGNKIMSQQKMKFRFIAFFLAAVFALTMISLPVWATGEQASPVLYGDILIGSDSENLALHEVVPGEEFTFTGHLNVEAIRQQIKDIADNHSDLKPVFNQIKLDDVKSIFTVTLELPDGLVFSGKSTSEYQFTSDPNNIFMVSACVKNGNELTITMPLKNSEKYTNFQVLYDDVTDCPDLDIMIPGVIVDSQVEIGKELTTKGTVGGSFSAVASFGTGTPTPFTFLWSAVQDLAGKDYKFKNDPTNTDISYTVIVVKPQPQPQPQPQPDEQDILIPCPYPCQVPPMWNPQPQPSQVIQQVQPMPQAPVQNVDAAQAQAPIQLPKTGEKSTQPLSLFFLLSASALFLLRRKMR